MTTAAIDLSKLTINGAGLSAHVQDAILSLSVHDTITGASTVELTLSDRNRALLNSGLFSIQSTIVVGNVGYELVAARKNADTIDLTFEDAAVAELRKKTGVLKVAAKQMTRVDFCRRLAREVSWIDVHAAQSPLAQESLSRDANEDSWTAMSRIMGSIGWRVFAFEGDVYIYPDSYLIGQSTGTYFLGEDSPGVLNVDFDFDTGKKAAAATVTVQLGTNDVIPGSPAVIGGLGPANGGWIVENIDRTYGTNIATISLLRPTPTLPEPTEGATNPDTGLTGYKSTLTGDTTNTGTAAASSKVEQFVQIALQQQGKPYVWGASGPNSFDCSGLVQWCAAKVGVTISKPVSNIYATMKAEGRLISVDQGINTRGALLMELGGSTNHVVISLGNGQTMEAMGTAYGCLIGKARGRGFNYAALPKGLFN